MVPLDEGWGVGERVERRTPVIVYYGGGLFSTSRGVGKRRERAGESVSDDEAGRTPKSSGGENVNGGHKGAREGRDCLAREEESRRAYIHTCTRQHPYVTESDGEKSAAASFGVDFAQHHLILPLCDSTDSFSPPPKWRFGALRNR
ncbi:hypothetical protein NPIL_326601 [Nephila pilipes]|uniref:Uncharacterized protein n=1 Tax=Nephila pilipes TaxID=299642 RepID=A0A8X6NQD7_NEPPI|nr:hypothetical protein NPIL_326601 [Nephila pilipes]